MTGPLTFLFTDLENSTPLWENYPVEMRQASARHDTLLRGIIEQHRGQVVKTTGDGFHAMFESPSDAVAAALASQLVIGAEHWPETTGPLKVRIGLHTGESQEREGDYYGPEVNLAARVMGLGHGGQVLLSDTTATLVKRSLPENCSLLELGEHRLKGISAIVQIHQLCHPDLAVEFPALKSLAAFKHNLHRQLSTFIGREKELAEVKHLLKSTSLLTLLGPGGTGKTRLMLQVAEEVIEDFPDGVWLVELAPLTDPNLIPERVAAALNVQEQPGRKIVDTLTEYLRRKELLLLLDNVEHIVQASAEITEHLLQHCPKLKILVTGREALFIEGETTIQIPPLSLPKEKQTLEEIAASEGVQLFLERARAVRPDFALMDQNGVTIAEVVRRLDGIPLALELAAARLRMLTIEQIHEHLNDRFRLLTGGRRTALPRQQTLQALIDWSWQLLDEPERVLLRRLSVFSGGWTLDAAQKIPGFYPLDEFEVFDHLDQLINKSLVLVDFPEAGEARYGLLESIRQFAQDKLFEANEGELLRDRHAEYYVAFTVKAREELFLQDALTWVDRLRRELDNQRAVIAWTQHDRPELALRMLGHLQHNRGHWLAPQEAETWFQAVMPQFRVLANDGNEEVDMGDYIQALLAQGLNETVLGRNATMREIAGKAVELARLHKFDRLFASAIALRGLAYSFEMTPDLLLEMEEAVQLCRLKGYFHELALLLMMLGGLYTLFGDTQKGKQYLEELEQVRENIRSPLGLAIITESLGGLAFVRGDLESARLLTVETVEIFEKLGARQNLVMARSRLGHILRRIGDITGAEDIYRQTILSWQELGNLAAVAHQLECFAFLAIADENHRRAAMLIGAAKATRKRLNAPNENPMELVDMKEALAQLASATGEVERDRMMVEGAKLNLDEAVALALKEVT